MNQSKINKHKRVFVISIIALIISYPFLFLLLNQVFNLNCGELYTFGLSLKDFLTPWIAFWGIIGAALNVWFLQRRVSIMEKQRNNQQDRWDSQQIQFNTQIEKQNEQIQIQQKQLQDSRFATGVNLLGNSNESARIGGVYCLYYLANEFRDDYLIPVCEIICAHIRSITRDNRYQEAYNKMPSNEIQTIIDLLFKKDKNETIIFENCQKNLTRTFLHGVDFFRAKITNTHFYFSSIKSVTFLYRSLKESALTNVGFNSATLNDVKFIATSQTDVEYINTKFINVDFTNASLNNVRFSGSVLGKCKPAEIILPGLSLLLTKPQGETN
jgi:hypothetical protein